MEEVLMESHYCATHECYQDAVRVLYNNSYHNYTWAQVDCSFQSSEVDLMSSPIFLVCVYVMYTAVFIVALFGNGMVCFVVHSSPRMKTVTNYFIVNLAVGDILMTVFCVPFTFVSMLALRYWPFGLLMCKVVNYSQAVSVLVSAYTLLAISIDRYIVIMRPLQPRLGKAHARLVVAGVWIGALATAAPIPIVSKLQKPSPWHIACDLDLCQEHWPSGELSEQYTCALLVLQFALPLCALIWTYARIAHVVWGGRCPGEAQTVRDSRLQSSKRKMVKMMVTVVAVFTICWLPLNVFIVLWTTHEGDEEWSTWPGMPYAFFASHWLAMSHCCYNPIIYGYMNARYRRGFKQILGGIFCIKMPDSSHSTHRLSICEGVPLSAQVWSKLFIYDERYYLHTSKRILALTSHVFMNTETSLRHLKKYIDMHVGTIDFELGLIAGVVLKAFRNLLKNYREMSYPPKFTKDGMNYIKGLWGGYYHYEAQLFSLSFMNEIYEYKNAFDNAVAKQSPDELHWFKYALCSPSSQKLFSLKETAQYAPGPLAPVACLGSNEVKGMGIYIFGLFIRYMAEQKIITRMKKNCRKEGRCPSHEKMAEIRREKNKKRQDNIQGKFRRSFDIDISQQVDQDTGELESDYFGHQVPKTSKKKDQGPDIVDQLFNTVERSVFEDPPEIKPTMESDDNFTKINDWLQYLANGGLEKNKKKAEEEEEELRKEVKDELTESPSTLKPLTSNWPFANGEWPNTHSDNIMKDVYFDENDNGAKNLKKTPSPWSRPGSDIEVKKKMKQQFYDKMRGSFDPKREGIDIDLYDYTLTP